MNALEVVGLKKSYGRKVVLDCLDMHVPQGAIYGFLGANGAGKTTTMKIIATTEGTSSGSVLLFGKERHVKDLGRMGFVIEGPALYENNSCFENLFIHALISNVQKPKARAREVLELVGLQEAAKKTAATCSMGMRQRLAIGIALLHDPEILVFDEPTNGLDIEGARDIRTIIEGLGRAGKTVVVSSHILSEIEKVCSHIGVLSKGKMVFEGTKEEFMKLGPDIEENYVSLTQK